MLAIPSMILTDRAYAAGDTAAAFLNLGYGARASAMGESFVAMNDDASVLHYNPGGLAFRPDADLFESASPAYEVLGSYSMRFGGISLSQAGFTKRPYGISVTHVGYGDMERRSAETEAADGSFGASDLAIGASYGRRFGDVGVGGTVKFIRQSIYKYSATAYAVDAGALYRFRELPLTLGASLTNLGTQVRFIEQGYSLPLMFRVGAAAGHTEFFPHIATLQVETRQGGGLSARLGFEYLGLAPVALRAGYKTMSSAQRKSVAGETDGMSALYGLSLGVGVESGMWRMDYAFAPYGELGNAHMLTFGARFGRNGNIPDYSTQNVYQPARTREELLPAQAAESAAVPGKPEYEVHLANARGYWVQEDRERAFAEYEAALRLAPEDGLVSLHILEREGLLFLEQKDYRKAKRLYVASIKVAKSRNITNDDVVNAYLGLAYCQARQGSYKWALANYREAWNLTKSEATKGKIERSLVSIRKKLAAK